MGFLIWEAQPKPNSSPPVGWAGPGSNGPGLGGLWALGPAQHITNYTVLISVRNRTLLRDEWRLVKVLFIDEVSLLSEQLICEIDHALRYATEKPDEWFGGITIIFAGDFFSISPNRWNTIIQSNPQCK